MSSTGSVERFVSFGMYLSSEKKGYESKPRRKRKSREEAEEDENLAKKIIIRGSAIRRNTRQQEAFKSFDTVGLN